MIDHLSNDFEGLLSILMDLVTDVTGSYQTRRKEPELCESTSSLRNETNSMKKTKTRKKSEQLSNAN